MKVVISSGHGKYISGAVGPSPWGLHEHTEAVRVVDQTAIELRALGVEVITYEDTVSHTQDENLSRLVGFHNSQGAHSLDVSVHFNSTDPQPTGPVGCEVFYESQAGMEFADEVVDAICTSSGLKNRGPKDGNLYFLNHTDEVAILVEICFVNSHADVDIYHAKFADICAALAAGIAGTDVAPGPTPPPPGVLFSANGTCSWFGGPDDTGVSPSEGLAFIYNFDEAPFLFLPKQPSGTSGLARRLDPGVFYIACRWDYDVTPKTMLRDSGQMALVTARKTGIARLAHPADWGPHEEQTGRAADLSPGLMDNLGLDTDDEVEVIYPYAP